MPQAVFFDLDETLIRHTTPVMEQFQLVCQRHLANLSEPHWNIFQEHLLSNVGRLWDNIAEHQGRCEAAFAEIFRSGLELAGCDAALAEPMIEAFLAAVVDSSGPAAGAHEVLDRLAEAGIATGIITNGFGFLQQRKARTHGLTKRVRIVVTSEDAGAHKPDARIFRLALERIGVDAADCWYVGDNYEKDIAGALGARLRAVLYDPERRLVDAESSRSAAYRIITSLTELPDLIAAPKA